MVYGGRDCFKVDATTINTDYLAKAYDKISSSKYLFEETLIPHPLISAIYPHSMNTLRIHTCIYKNGKIDLYQPICVLGHKEVLWRAGVLGTIFIDVDMESGTLRVSCEEKF